MRPARILLALVLGLLLGGCGQARSGPSYPPAGATPVTATTETAAARAAVTQALAPTGLVLAATPQPYRPPEGPWLAAAPREVLEVDAPAGGPVGYVVLYGLASTSDATAAAVDQAAFVQRPTSQVYFPTDARFVIRTLGNAVIFFTWSPAASDPRAADLAGALAEIGTPAPGS